jgi:hypothetical protein
MDGETQLTRWLDKLTKTFRKFIVLDEISTSAARTVPEDACTDERTNSPAGCSSRDTLNRKIGHLSAHVANVLNMGDITSGTVSSCGEGEFDCSRVAENDMTLS